jgi:hypothetical protein
MIEVDDEDDHNARLNSTMRKETMSNSDGRDIHIVRTTLMQALVAESKFGWGRRLVLCRLPRTKQSGKNV